MPSESPTEPPPGQPAGYWAVKVVGVCAIVALAAFDLTTTENVATEVYGLIAGLVGGVELASIVRSRK